MERGGVGVEMNTFTMIVAILTLLFVGGTFLCTLIFGILNAANNQAKK